VSNTSAVESNETLKLTEWELGNLHLPPVTTVTLYEGIAPVEFLRSRIARMLAINPWLTSRIVKKNAADGVAALTYSKSLDVESAVEQHLSIYEHGEVGLSLGMSYEEIVGCLLPVQCARSKPATDEDEVLFKVAVVPIEAETGAFALVVSMNHTLGDGHTYYKLYNMLGVDAQTEELDPVRVAGFEEAKTDIIGKEETAMFTSAGLSFGIVGTYLGAKLRGRGPQNVCVHEVESAWVTKEKDRSGQEAQVPFVSSNDVLTSWFFREMKSDMNIMVANLRSRRPAVLNLSDAHVGTYEANLPYFPGDIESPALIRQSIQDTEGTFRAKRAGSPVTKIPSSLKLLRNRTSIVTNWASFYCDVNLQKDPHGNNESTLRPKLHFPIMEPDGIITSVWNNAIIFRPRAGELGMLTITRQFDNDTLAQEKEQDGPLGKRIL